MSKYPIFAALLPKLLSGGLHVPQSLENELQV
jgi:hypothetical protein